MNYSREYLKTNSIIESWPLKEEERRLLPSLSPETVSNATFCTFPVGKGFCHRLPSDGWRCSAHHHVIGHSDDNDDELNETEPVSWAWSNGDDIFRFHSQFFRPIQNLADKFLSKIFPTTGFRRSFGKVFILLQFI